MRSSLLTIILLAGCIAAVSQTNQSPKASPAEVMRDLRMKMLTNSPAELGQKTSPEFPHVSGVLMDWPLGNATVSIVSLSTGDASVYTTATFGVIGGIGHEPVRRAAIDFVKVAEHHFNEAKPANDYSYPKPDRVRFYLVCYDGVRTLDADLKSVESGNSECADLFNAGQRVLTEFRQVTKNFEPPANPTK